MRERLGLRLRFALFFVGLACGGIAVLISGLWLGWSRAGGPPDGYVTAGLVGTLGLLGLTAWVALLFDENVARPILGLAADLQTRAAADIGGKPIEERPARYLGALAPSANAINAALEGARRARVQAVEAETRLIAREKAMFAALLRDLAEGVVVINPKRRIMLYNRAAQELLDGLGLDRPLDAAIRSEPLDQAIERLAARGDSGDTKAEPFLVADASGTRFLLGQVTPVSNEDEPLGHVLILRDATEDLEAHAERDHLFNTLMEQVRRPASAMGSILELLLSGEEVDPQTRATFDAGLRQELGKLYRTLRELEERHEAATTRHWPMARVTDGDILDALQARGVIPIRTEPSGLFADCDGYAIFMLLANVLDGLTSSGSRSGFRLRSEAREGETWFILSWQGDMVPDGLLQDWLAQPLSDGYGRYSGRDALTGHRTDIWAERSAEGPRIVLPLPAADTRALSPVQARPEFYDFNLSSTSGDLGDRPLSALTFVVFDTETTGLAPRGGDEIIQIAAVRIVNGRILTGEVFDTLIDPARPIPAASTAVHRITDAMVDGAPTARDAIPAFHDFCTDAVLVAHNAPFDLAFLQEKEAETGRRFDMPALCTVLLSAALFDHTGNHTLDALSDRLGVVIAPEDRHTALGDAKATAEVFLKLMRLLEDTGVRTLDEAVAASLRQVRIRKAQSY